MDSNLRLVIADADSNYRAMLCEAAREAGGISVVGEAGSGAEVLRLLERQSADVLLLDLILPDGDGIYVMDRLRKSGSKIRIVVNSGFFSSLTWHECNQFQVSTFVMKPNDPELLFGRIVAAYQHECGAIPEPQADHSDLRLATDILVGIQFPARYSGYDYLRETLMVYMSGNDIRRCLSTVVFPEIAAKYGTRRQNIERDIRTAIGAYWKNGGALALYNYLGVRLTKRPTVNEFIHILIEHLGRGDNRRLG